MSLAEYEIVQINTSEGCETVHRTGNVPYSISERILTSDSLMIR